MKSKALSLISGAGAASMLFFAACQQSETPVQPGSQDAGMTTPADAPAGSSQMVGEGRKATDAELARYLAEHKDVPGIAPAKESPTALAKAAVLPICRVDFNNVNSLAALPDQANQGYSYYPYYKHPCNGSYSVLTQPANTDTYRLIPEDPYWCAGLPPLIGHQSGAYCYNRTEGKYWPRRAGNLGSNTGVEFYVTDALYYKDFDLRSLYVYSGTVEVEAYRPGIGLWYWYPLTAGTTWTWPAGTRVSQVKIFSHGRNGYIRFDNMDIAIVP
jgi:hypothetical protein